MRYCLGPPDSYGPIWAALAFMPFGLFFDFMDGKVARWRKKSSLMGQELDSLADLISFGVSPAACAFALGLRSAIDSLLLSFFVLCGLTRLARFNVTVSALPKDATGKSKYFEGTPIPTSLAIVAGMAWCVSQGSVNGGEHGVLGGTWGQGIMEVHPIVGIFVGWGCAMSTECNIILGDLAKPLRNLFRYPHSSNFGLDRSIPQVATSPPRGLGVDLEAVLLEGQAHKVVMANMRFAVGIRRLVPFLGYHHVLMILIAIAIVLLSLLLAGCSSSSPQIPNIFLISLYYKSYAPTFDPAQVDPGVTTAIANIVGQAQLEVRVGYFGICINPDGGAFLCSNNASSLAGQVSVDQDPLNLIWVASTFKDSIVFPYLIIVAIVLAFITFLLLATFPGWHEETDERGSERDVKPFPSRPVSQVALALIFIASVFVLVSVLWQHTASVAASTIAQDLGNGSVKSGVGTTAMILGWFGFALLIIVTIGLLVMILSISLLDRLTDD
ncbi:CDP-diacylglycerol--serine O-phosphatidyltransferase [Physcia stellaris]|nr:CDP-diacylglycerol--serine O-phosphatidyltransferase [Physcia stellaris]